jgi:hypothetical protein
LGFYFGCPSGTEHLEPVITPREYAGILDSAMRAVVASAAARSDAHAADVDDPERWPHATIQALSKLVQEQPANAIAHRRLGVAYLCGGDDKAGLEHMKIALRIFHHEAGRLSLHQRLCARLEAALTILALVPVCARSDRRKAVRRLVGRLLAQ